MKKVHDKRSKSLNQRLMQKWGFNVAKSQKGALLEGSEAYNRDDDDDDDERPLETPLAEEERDEIEERKQSIIQQMIAEISAEQDRPLNEAQMKEIEESIKRKLREGFFDRLGARASSLGKGVSRAVKGGVGAAKAGYGGKEFTQAAVDISSEKICHLLNKKAKKLAALHADMKNDWEKMDFDMTDPKSFAAKTLRKVEIAAQGLAQFAKKCEQGKVGGVGGGGKKKAECQKLEAEFRKSNPDVSEEDVAAHLARNDCGGEDPGKKDKGGKSPKGKGGGGPYTGFQTYRSGQFEE